jgi:UDP-N-acetylmuramoyl-tripeptide--D-alanyl-D-alanine ligase
MFDPAELAAWCHGVWGGVLPDGLTGVSIDSRVVQPGELYVALPGAHVDGHDYVDEALARGAAGAMVASTRYQDRGKERPLLYVQDTGAALTALAKGHRAQCAARFIGITGSVGKTSVKEILADMLAKQGTTGRTHGNWNNALGLPLSLLQLPRDAAYGVYEIGMNHPGELAPLCDVLQPQAAIITPIGPVHLENFDSVECIADEKATLSRAVPRDGWVVLSVDDPYVSVLRRNVQARIVTVSMRDADADYRGSYDPGNKQLIVCERHGACAPYPMPLPGAYMAENALRAIAAARTLGLEPEQLANALAGYKPPPMRWNNVTIAGVHFINDAYNANPVSMRAALDALREKPVEGRRWLVLAGMYELGPTGEKEHVELGAVVAEQDWAGLIAVGEYGAWIAEGARAAGMSEARILRCGDTGEAATLLYQHASPGDTVLVKASRGEKLEQVLKEFENKKAADHGVQWEA